MSPRNVAVALAGLALLFLVLNFVTDAGTLFLILAVASALGAAFLWTRHRA